MTKRSLFLKCNKHGGRIPVTAVLLLSLILAWSAEPVMADTGSLLVTTTTSDGSVTTTADGKKITGSDLSVVSGKTVKIGKVPLFSDNRKLGAYVDRQVAKHKKTIVFYSWRKDLMSTKDYNSTPYNLANYSFMLAGIRPSISFKISRTKKQVVVTDASGKEKIKHPIKYKLKIKYRHSKAKDKKFYKTVRKVARRAQKFKTSRARAKYINNYVIDHVKGDKNAWRNTTACSTLTSGRAACQGYAETFKVLARASGLKAELIIGRLSLGRGKYGMHAWNIVKVGKKWYYLDPSWNDQPGRWRNKYLLKGKRGFEKLRKPLRAYKTKAWKKAHPMKK